MSEKDSAKLSMDEVLRQNFELNEAVKTLKGEKKDLQEKLGKATDFLNANTRARLENRVLKLTSFTQDQVKRMDLDSLETICTIAGSVRQGDGKAKNIYLETDMPRKDPNLTVGDMYQENFGKEKNKE